MDAAQIEARERPWLTRVGLAGIVGGLLALVGFIVLQAAIGGGANFESLEKAQDNSAQVWLAGLATGLGYLLLTAPLYFLFRAAQGRTERVKNQMVGLVVLGPVLLAISAPVVSGGTQQAADKYIGGEAASTLKPGEAKEECADERSDKTAEEFAEDFEPAAGETPAAACEAKKGEEDRASEAIKDSSLLTIGQFMGLAGTLSLLFALLYTGLWSMRTGLLTRFWGSLGMAVGIASLIGFSPLTFLWFIYLGLLLLGVLPGGRPPAWAAGEAIPWPTAGQKAAGEMEPSDPDDAIDVDSEEIDDFDQPPQPPYSNGEAPKKRKRRE